MDRESLEILSRTSEELIGNVNPQGLAGKLIKLLGNSKILKNSELVTKIKTVLSHPKFAQFTAQYGILTVMDQKRKNRDSPNEDENSVIIELLKDPAVIDYTAKYGILAFKNKKYRNTALTLLKDEVFKEHVSNYLDQTHKQLAAQKTVSKLAKYHGLLNPFGKRHIDSRNKPTKHL